MKSKTSWPPFKPYTLEPIRTGFLGRTEWSILFEGTSIRTTTLPYEEAKDIVLLLNIAYTMGATSAG